MGEFSPLSRRRCEAFDEVEDAPLWMQYMAPSGTSYPMAGSDTASPADTQEFSPMMSDCREIILPTEDEMEERPLWMRYLPNNKIIPKAHTILPIGRHVISMSDEGTSIRKKIVLKRSLNPFGPTSTHAVTVENPIQAKRKRSDDDDEMMEECPAPEAIEEDMAKRKYLRSTRQRVVNVSEAAELFSIVNIKH